MHGKTFKKLLSIGLLSAACFVGLSSLTTTGAEARPRHGIGKSHHAAHHHVQRGRHAHGRRTARRAHAAKRRYARARRDEGATHLASGAAGVSFGMTAIVDEARRFLGNTARQLGLPSSLWCADFMNYALKKAGKSGTGSRMASSFASYGKRVSGPQVGAIAVMSRGRRGGHVGIVSGIDKSGNPILISGNHGRKVAEALYSRKRIYAYVMPE
jgi:uncharacterized protein (TIGR02594 family)